MRYSSARGRKSGQRACFGVPPNASASPARARRSASPTRARLCKNIDALRDERERLRSITLRQRRELDGIEDAFHRLRARCAEADLAWAGFAYDNCASSYFTDVARLQHRALDGQRQRLEEELNGFKRGASRLREVRELTMQQDADRAAWDDQERRLEREIAAARERLTSLESVAKRQAAEFEAIARHQSAACAVEEDLAKQHRLREEAERQRLTAEAELASVIAAAPCSSQAELLVAERQKLCDLKLQLSRAGADRGRQRENIQASMSDLERMRQELQSLTDDNLTLRGKIQRSLHCLGRIQRQSAEAEELGAVAIPGAGVGSWRPEPLPPAAPRLV